MVLGPKFPWHRIRKTFTHTFQPAPFKFDPFGDEAACVNPVIEQLADFLELDNPPLPQTVKLLPEEEEDTGLKHPRPVRSVALKDALDHFEEIAQSIDDNCYEDFSSPSTPESEVDVDLYAIRLVPPPVHRDAPVDALALMAKLEAIAKAQPAAYRFDDASPSPILARSPRLPEPREDGIACLSPGFLDHFPGHARQGQPPMPTFALRNGKLCRTSSTSSSSGYTPSLISPAWSTDSLPMRESPSSPASSLSPDREVLSKKFSQLNVGNKFTLRPAIWDTGAPESGAAYANDSV